MWGDEYYPMVDEVHGIMSIAEATYRFVHGEIRDTHDYQRILVSIMDICERTLNASGASEVKRTRAYKKLANERLYGKTSIEMFVALEIAVTLAQAENPDIALRKYLTLALPGLLALQQSVGPWVDTSDALMYKYGPSDMGSNIASSCMWFAANFYTKSMTSCGEFAFTVAPTRDFVAVRTTRSLVGSVLFDYVKLLFPATSEYPEFDAARMQYKIQEIQARIDMVYELESRRIRGMYQFGSYGSVFYSRAERIDVNACLTKIMHLGTNKAALSNFDVVQIAAVDSVIIPFVSGHMNQALRVSTFRL